MNIPASVQTVILTGSRSSHSSLLHRFGASSKAMLPLLGQSLVSHILSMLRSTDGNFQVAISGDDEQTRRFAEMEGLTYLPSGNSAVDSIHKALAHSSSAAQVLFISGDHPLLTSEMVKYFIQKAAQRRLALALAVVPRRIITEQYPQSRRTYVRFKGEAYSGGNLIYIDRESFRENPAFMEAIERYRKAPWRYPFLFDPVTMVRLLLRRLDLQQVSNMVSRQLGCDVGAIEMPFAECAMDVDSSLDLILAEQVLKQRFRSGSLNIKAGGTEENRCLISC